MENHPIPQDVTGFQFKLIGDMTVKQFAYLAVGIVLAWIFLQLPISFLIKIPLCAFFSILGIGLAFFPVSGRPMDLMIGNYIKALFSPTQFVYEKKGQDLYFANKPIKPISAAKVYKNNFNPLPKDKLKVYLENQALEKKNNSTPNLTTANFNVPQPSKPTPTIMPTVNIPSSSSAVQPSTPTLTPTPSKMASRFVRNTGMPRLPDSPNLITGIVKDPRGNPLPNILIEVRDKEDNPVRAFKTNEVGRFASATALLNGTYTIYLEDPKGQNKFETKTINAMGQIITPIEAISIDTREELRRSLFNNSYNSQMVE